MAFLDLTAGHPFEALPVAEPVSLGPQERLVVLLSRRDPLWSLQRPQRRLKVLRWLFGIEAPHSLADCRLEALRRYAVTYRLLGRTAEQALDAGFTAHQLAQVRALIDRDSATPRRPAAVGPSTRRCWRLLPEERSPAWRRGSART